MMTNPITILGFGYFSLVQVKQYGYQRGYSDDYLTLIAVLGPLSVLLSRVVLPYLINQKYRYTYSYLLIAQFVLLLLFDNISSASLIGYLVCYLLAMFIYGSHFIVLSHACIELTKDQSLARRAYTWIEAGYCLSCLTASLISGAWLHHLGYSLVYSIFDLMTAVAYALQ
jgi:hypothetical protein